MYKAEYSIRLWIIAGVYRPIELLSLIKKILYNTFTLLVIILFYSFNISLCTYLILYSTNDIDEFAESLCWLLSTSVGCVKMTNVLLQQNNILKLIDILNQDCLQINDNREKVMQDKCDHIAR